MRVPTVVARSLANYVNSGGAESVKARVMLNAMGWHSDGSRASQQEIETARLIWSGQQPTILSEEIPL